jgi:hypothetical protein
MTLETLIFRSRAVSPPGHLHLFDLMTRTYPAIRRRGITGLLHYEAGVFTHWIEGPADAVVALWQRIQRDYRHTAVELLRREVRGDQRFMDWGMSFEVPLEFTRQPLLGFVPLDGRVRALHKDGAHQSPIPVRLSVLNRDLPPENHPGERLARVVAKCLVLLRGINAGEASPVVLSVGVKHGERVTVGHGHHLAMQRQGSSDRAEQLKQGGQHGQCQSGPKPDKRWLSRKRSRQGALRFVHAGYSIPVVPRRPQLL